MGRIYYGLKIWSTNRNDLFREAVQLFRQKKFDFLELYLVPGSLDPEKLEILSEFKKQKVPVTIHCPHDVHNFDISKLDYQKEELFKNLVLKTADFLGSKYIVVHPGLGDSYKIFEENIQKINDKRILIENMAKVGPNPGVGFGHSLEQLKFIRGLGFNFCLDFSHAVKSAASQKIDYKKFIEELISALNPSYFHICNGQKDYEIDEHRDLFDGEFDIKWIKEILLGLKKDVYLVFETPKVGDNLENDIKNIKYFQSI